MKFKKGSKEVKSVKPNKFQATGTVKENVIEHPRPTGTKQYPLSQAQKQGYPGLEKGDVKPKPHKGGDPTNKGGGR